MPKYHVVEECTYIVDGRSVQHREPGALVDLDSKTAESLGSAVKAVREPETAAPTVHPEKKTLRPKSEPAAPDSDTKTDQP